MKLITRVKKSAINNLIVIILIFTAVVLGSFINDVNEVGDGQLLLYENFNRMTSEYIKNEVVSGVKNDILSKATIDVNNMKDSILKTYDTDSLRNDLTHPDKDMEIYKIFRTYIENTEYHPYINTFISMDDKILLDLKKCNKLDNRVRTWGDIILHSPNSEMTKQCIDNIVNKNTHFEMWQSKDDYRLINFDKLDIDDVYMLVSEYGVDVLRSIKGLVIVYITEDGDIFGIKDIDNVGDRQHTQKIAVIHEFNLYDAFICHEKNSNTYSVIKKSEYEIKSSFRYYRKQRSMTMLYIAAMSIIISFGLMTIKNSRLEK